MAHEKVPEPSATVAPEQPPPPPAQESRPDPTKPEASNSIAPAEASARSPADGRHEAPSSSSGPSTKDHLERLRSVHFGLLALCFGLVAVTDSMTPKELQEAQQQAQVFQSLASNDEWLNDGIAETAKELIAPEKADGNFISFVQDAKPPGGTAPPHRFYSLTGELELDGEEVTATLTPVVSYTIDSSDPPRLLTDPFQKVLQSQRKHLAARERLLSPLPRNFAEFDALAAALKAGATVYLATGIATTFVEVGSTAQNRWKLSPPGVQPEVACDLDLVPDPAGHSWAAQCKSVPPLGPKGRVAFSLRFGARIRQKYATQTELTRFVLPANTDLSVSHFELLRRFASRLPTKTFEEIRNELDDTLKQSREDRTVLGVNVRNADVARVGAWVVVVFQLYFLIHLIEISTRRRRANHDEVAWMGVYGHWLAIIALVASAFALPVFTVIWLRAPILVVMLSIAMALGGVTLWATSVAKRSRASTPDTPR